MEDDHIVHACLDELGEDYNNFTSSMNIKEDISKLIDVISMLILEENNLALDTFSSQGKTKSKQVFYSSFRRGRGCRHGQVNGLN